MTNTIKEQIHHPMCSDSNCPGSMSQSPPVKNTRDAPLTDDIGGSHMHLCQTPPLFVMTHFQFRKRAPPKMNSALRGRTACENRSLYACNLVLVGGGETCGVIFVMEKVSFVFLLNVNVTRAS